MISDAIGDHKGLLDLTGANLRETASHVVVEIQLASFDPPTIARTLRAQAYRDLRMEVCWNPDANPNRPGLQGHECAGIVLFADDKLPVVGYFASGYGPDEGCNDWLWCEWRMPYRITPGTPATVEVDVPRQLMSNGSASAVLVRPYAELIARRDSPGEARNLGREAWVMGCVLGRCANHGLRFGQSVEGDLTPLAADVVLTMPMERIALGSGSSTILTDQTGEIRDARGPRKDLDIVSVDIEETATQVAFVVKVADLPRGANHEFDMDLGLGGTVYEAWYSARGGVPTDALVGYCADAACGTWREHGVNVVLQPGAPGTIRVGIRWADLLSHPAGTLVTLAEAEIADLSGGHYQAVPAVGYASARTSAPWDYVYHAEPYYLRQGSPTM